MKAFVNIMREPICPNGPEARIQGELEPRFQSGIPENHVGIFSKNFDNGKHGLEEVEKVRNVFRRHGGGRIFLLFDFRRFFGRRRKSFVKEIWLVLGMIHGLVWVIGSK